MGYAHRRISQRPDPPHPPQQVTAMQDLPATSMRLTRVRDTTLSADQWKGHGLPLLVWSNNSMRINAFRHAYPQAPELFQTTITQQPNLPRAYPSMA